MTRVEVDFAKRASASAFLVRRIFTAETNDAREPECVREAFSNALEFLSGKGSELSMVRKENDGSVLEAR